MTPCISEACTMPATLADDVAAWADAGCPLMEIWLTKLENHLESSNAISTKSLFATAGVTIAAAAYQGGLLLSQGEARAAHFAHYRRRLELCESLAIPVLLIVADFQDRVQKSDLERAVVSLAQAAQWAAGFGVRLGLEFRGANTFCSSLDTAIRLTQACGEPNVGVVLDVFHFYTGPSKFEDLSLLTAQNLAHVQVCDVSGVPRELASDADRILPGDGDWRIEPIMRRLYDIAYTGPVSLEVMNPEFWQSTPKQVAGIGMSALNRLLRS